MKRFAIGVALLALTSIPDAARPGDEQADSSLNSDLLSLPAGWRNLEPKGSWFRS